MHGGHVATVRRYVHQVNGLRRFDLFLGHQLFGVLQISGEIHRRQQGGRPAAALNHQPLRLGFQYFPRFFHCQVPFGAQYTAIHDCANRYPPQRLNHRGILIAKPLVLENGQEQ